MSSRYLLWFSLLLFFPFYAISFDEIISPQIGYLTNDKQFKPQPATPRTACAAIRSANPSIEETRGPCPTVVSQSGSSSWVCLAEFYYEPEGNPAYCFI